MIETEITRMLGIAHPVMLAGMARVTQADLVIAVSSAGGIGCLGGVSYLPDALRGEIRRIRAEATGPFAVNLLLPEALTTDDTAQWAPVQRIWNGLAPEERVKMRGVESLLTPGAVRGQVEVVLEERPDLVVLTFATPPDFIAACHERGIRVAALVGSVGRARAAETAGVDFLIAQGMEAGGHTGYVSTMVLIPEVLDAVSIPVAAAGGIADARGLAAVLALGAGAAWVGTRFIATPEAYGHDAFKQRVVEGRSRDTVLTRAYTGKPLRAFRNAWTEDWEGRQGEIAGFPGQYAVSGIRVELGYQDGDTEAGMMPAGQAISLIHEVTPAADVVREMSEGAERIIAGLASR